MSLIFVASKPREANRRAASVMIFWRRSALASSSAPFWGSVFRSALEALLAFEVFIGIPVIAVVSARLASRPEAAGLLPPHLFHYLARNVTLYTGNKR